MATTALKICCIASPAEARGAAAAGATHLGLVGPMPTGPGVLTLAEARAIAEAAAGLPALPVLLTASDTAAAIVADAATAGVGAVQVVRPIAAGEAAVLAATGLTYIQVIHVEGAGALDLIAPYAGHCDAFLLDSGRPAARELGGTGRAHDWTVSAAFVAASPRPVFLAGGLTPANVGAAIAQVRPHGIDVCSGLRPAGPLDPGLLAAFTAAVSEANTRLANGG